MAESKWYRDLVALHGRSGVVVGPAPYSADERYWVSSTDEEEPSDDEHEQFYESLADRLEAIGEELLSNVDFLKRPYVVGDFYGIRSETLVAHPATLRRHFPVLLETIRVVRSHLDEHRRWRVGYWDPRGSLVMYRDSFFIGNHQFQDLHPATPALERWLATLV